MRYTERVAIVFAGVCVLLAVTFLFFSRSRAVRGTAGSAGGTVAREIMAVESGAFANGHWYLADGSAHTVHVLDSSGMHLRSIGGRGMGPGEFVAPVLVAASGAFLYVAELGRHDVSVFDTGGGFLRYLRPPASCRGGTAQSMAAQGDTLYLVRRCLELPKRIRHQLERSIAGGPFQPWLLADTVSLHDNGNVPINIRLVALHANRLVVANGDTGCFRWFRLPEGRLLGHKCLIGITRVPAPPPARSRAPRRVSFGDSLPRFAGLVLRDNVLVAQTVLSRDSVSWREFDWDAPETSGGRLLGPGAAGLSFLSENTLLLVHDDADGVRIEVKRVSH